MSRMKHFVYRLVCLGLLLAYFSASAFTTRDVGTIFSSLNNAFYSLNCTNGFIIQNGSTWTSWNIYNDDIMWAVIAFVRGGLATGRTNYYAIAKTNFDACYARSYDTNLGGGIYWPTGNFSKNAAVEGPAAIAAYFCSIRFTTTPIITTRARTFIFESTQFCST